MTSDEDRAEIDEGRAAMIEEIDVEPLVEVARVADLDVAGVPCRLLAPPDPLGTLVYLHGGGFVFGTRDTHERIARRLADTTGWAVLLVDYRLAPEAPFPAAYDDALAVARALPGSDLPAPYAVLGDSAGGNLALGVALAQATPWVAQVLVYPFLDPGAEHYDRGLDDSEDQLEEYAWYWSHYLAPGDEADPRADPLRADSFAGLPPTLVQLAGLDALAPVGRLVAERLRADGVATTVTTTGRLGHGFWRRAEHPESQQALAEVAAFLRGRVAGSAQV